MPIKKKGSARSVKSRGSSRSRSPSAKRKGKKSAKSARSSAKSRPSTSMTEQREPDMLDSVAMENLYYITHGAPDALEIRGFGWPMAGPKKKGRKGKKKKK